MALHPNMEIPCNDRPRGLLLQWHITNCCNLRCAHCYQEEFCGAELSFSALLEVLGHFEELLAEWRGSCPGAHIPGQITVTGGEPFIRTDFMDLLGEFHSRRDRFSFAVLSNGTLIDAKLARDLARLEPRFVQVSMEGSAETHDRIRGRGNHAQVIQAVQHLRRAGVCVSIAFTAHRENFREFPEVARLGRRLGVDRVWADRLIPSGPGADLDAMLSPQETKEYIVLMQQSKAEAEKTWFNRTRISAHRALQFLVCGGIPYRCRAGDSFLTLMPNGDLYPCRRMPIRVGNIFETSLIDLCYQSPQLRRLRDPQQVSAECASCFYSKLCRGGLRCLSYAVHKDPFHADPGCWLVAK